MRVKHLVFLLGMGFAVCLIFLGNLNFEKWNALSGRMDSSERQIIELRQQIHQQEKLIQQTRADLGSQQENSHQVSVVDLPKTQGPKSQIAKAATGVTRIRQSSQAQGSGETIVGEGAEVLMPGGKTLCRSVVGDARCSQNKEQLVCPENTNKRFLSDSWSISLNLPRKVYQCIK